MDHLLSCDSVRIVAATDRRDWKHRSLHPLETQIRSAAGTHIPVLISANRARARTIASQIHQRSAQRDHALLEVDCSAASHGYEQQVFQTDVGESGSMLLLEVNHLPASMQLRLRARLTVEARARAMGPASALIGRRRLLATCSGSLFEAVERGLFDRDLFYRLNVIHIVPNGL